MKEISIKKVLTTSFLVDVFDVGINLVIAVLTGSIVMTAETLQGAADLISAGFLLIGFRKSRLPADAAHPFGHGRELYFWTLLSALIMLVFTASLSFYFGLQRFLTPLPIQNIILAYIALLFAIISNGYAFSLSFRRLLKRESPKNIFKRFFQSSRVETKAAFTLDLMGTVSAVFGLIALLLFGITGNLRFDGLGAMSIGASLAILSFFLVLSVKDFLVGRSVNQETRNKIIRAALQIPEVEDVLDLKAIYIGPNKLLVNLEVHLKNNLTTNEIERLVDKIKERIQKEVPDVNHIQVELETPDAELVKVAARSS